MKSIEINIYYFNGYINIYVINNQNVRKYQKLKKNCRNSIQCVKTLKNADESNKIRKVGLTI